MMTAERDLHSYEFVSAKQMTKENLLELMVSASRTTPDLLLQREHTSMGLYPAVQKQMEELLDDEESDILFQILLVEGQPAGFISVNRLLDDVTCRLSGKAAWQRAAAKGNGHGLASRYS